MSQLAIVYHSAHGHTEFIARQVQAGASGVEGVDARLVRAEDIARTPDGLHAAPADAFVPGDVKTARLFGRHFAHSLNRLMVPA